MANYLVIVESPAKVKTISKFLGKNYKVTASGGHVRDLPKSQLGFDPEHDYEPKYITIRGKGDVLAALRKEVKKADVIYLATDPDREGEAISWHLCFALKLKEFKDKKVYRITFNEITKNAVKESIKHPREIDMDLVDAQQARRILDRMVGYRISPLLWSKVKSKLSAGRVQSATLKMIADREAEIAEFVPEEYWTMNVDLTVKGEKKPLNVKYEGPKQLSVGEDTEELEKELKKGKYIVDDIKFGKREKNRPLPFTTSTMQQEAAKVLNFPTQKTMRLAQQLYEGVDVKGSGTVALITYLRTDSTRVSDDAYAATKAYIEEHYGAEYVGAQPTGKKAARVQDAHEAIRPTDITRTPVMVKESLPRDLFRLYQLIYNRFLASCMTAAKYDTATVKIKNGEHKFSTGSFKLSFAGFMAVYTEADDKNEKSNELPGNLEKGMELKASAYDSEQHFTKSKPHFTEAALVKTMEEHGIGRPSTYAPTIGVLLNRRYVLKENKNLFLTDVGEAVNNIMSDCFPTIVDETFTANMEGLLDRIEDGSVEWKTVLENFYPDLDKAVVEAEKKLEKVELADEVTDVVCELCGRNMVIKYGAYGKFLACPGFPECRNTKPYLEKTGVACPECGKELVVRRTKKGRRFYGCEGAPECEYISWNLPGAGKDRK
ncbi:MAG: type I DNA topoisomerase [Lachnospiraceae bacterium]|nr:type I DNA topoisomerase [Lachnospiraceae bacterium]